MAAHHDVSGVIDDDTGSVIEASSGRAGDGMSVRCNEVAVENVDASTLRVTWVGLPMDDVAAESVQTTIQASLDWQG